VNAGVAGAETKATEEEELTPSFQKRFEAERSTVRSLEEEVFSSRPHWTFCVAEDEGAVSVLGR
jgi:hypothetical protein